MDFENVAHSLWNTLLTHLKVFCPSYGPLIIGPEPKNQTSIASINSGVDKVRPEKNDAHVASTPASMVALKACALASSIISFTLAFYTF